MATGRRARTTARHSAPGDRGRARGKTATNLWVVGALLLAVLSVAVLLNAIASQDGDDYDAEQAQQELEEEVAESAAPTAAEEAESIRVALAGIAEDISDEFGVSIGATMRAGGGIIHVGDIQMTSALSSIKVPISMAAVQQAQVTGEPVESLREDIDAAIMASDNDAALRLWESLGDETEAAEKVSAVLHQGGDPTNALTSQDENAYQGFGDIHWSLDHQVIFANRMACVNGADMVIGAMGQLIDEHSGGLGQLPDAHIKGGWGMTTDDEFILREFGLAGPAGSQVPLAVAVIPEDGTESTAREAMAEMSSRIAPLVEESSATGGDADCQGVTAP
ncbi:MAG: hypothetical protein L0J74_04840 [Corynebacterium sp.]|uniref:hypothetical protein n=1 Tax=Corynebacterium sp. TaxID=1720 RepID=UPI0026496A73|nr:hypothetical protein [Corynebacterium sp.]MDN5722969.1 hypothetical protein [Corynebacterium sp.]MDN6281586.1 hypothetical protein [Corynebacterium sp.]MDN6305121.1 hypothetical protein [Corynebacterium sp.]MDN6352937.1 hypothetical protein [Corynebacterium sp.]MDN6367354.1 hypothetical protein [Corynebacterium sp.]